MKFFTPIPNFNIFYKFMITPIGELKSTFLCKNEYPNLLKFERYDKDFFESVTESAVNLIK